MSLLQDVLRSTADSLAIESRLNGAQFSARPPPVDRDDSDDELVNVVSQHVFTVHSHRSLLCQVSLPGTPARTRPSSPTRGVGAAARPVPGPLHLLATSRTDPLKALPTEISQRIFTTLSVKDLAKCARVSKKWNRSQTINYGAHIFALYDALALMLLYSLVPTL